MVFFFILIANDYPGPSDFSTSGSLIWKNKKVTIKGRNKCYFDEEGNNIYQKLKKKKYDFIFVSIRRLDGQQIINRQICLKLFNIFKKKPIFFALKFEHFCNIFRESSSIKGVKYSLNISMTIQPF